MGIGGWVVGFGDWVVESVTRLSVSVIGLWEIVSGLCGFGFVGMDLAMVAVVVLLDFRWWCGGYCVVGLMSLLGLMRKSFI